jgi:hypothetical protein
MALTSRCNGDHLGQGGKQSLTIMDIAERKYFGGWLWLRRSHSVCTVLLTVVMGSPDLPGFQGQFVKTLYLAPEGYEFYKVSVNRESDHEGLISRPRKRMIGYR